MGEGYNVNIDEVRNHAQTVGTIASTVRSVAGGAQDSVSGGAFGQIAEFFASAITGAANDVRAGMNDASATVDQVQQGLQMSADAYQTTEERHVQLFSSPATGENK